MVQQILSPPPVTGRAAFGLLLLRIVVGLAFIFHGFGKIQHPASWMTMMMGPHAFAPPFFQVCAALAEFVGGIALIVGLLTPLVAIALIIDMAVAILFVHIPNGGQFVGGRGAFELPLTYLVSALLVLLTGPGAFSLDALIFGQSAKPYRR